MRGSIRTMEKCPICGGAFTAYRHPLTRDVIDLMCPAHRTRPERVYIDGRHLKDRHGAVGYKFTGNDGRPYEYFGAAHRDLEAIRKEIDDKTFLSTRHSPKAIGEHHVERACDPWLDFIKANRSREYAAQQRHFFSKYIIPTMGRMDTRSLRGIDIINFQKHLTTLPIGTNTERSILTALRSCLSWLKKQDVIDRIPAFPVLRPVPRQVTGWIEPEDQRKVIALMREDMRLLLETMFALGARPGEAVALKVRDLRDGAVRVERALDCDRNVKGTKTGAVNNKIISPELYARLVELTKDRLPEAWLFTNHAGKPFHVTQVSWMWRKAADTMGVKACLYVASRHSRVSQLREELEKRVAEQLRAELAHKSASTTLRFYCREKETGSGSGGGAKNPL